MNPSFTSKRSRSSIRMILPVVVLLTIITSIVAVSWRSPTQAAATTVAPTSIEGRSEAERKQVFDYIVEKTMSRTAWSPYTPGRPDQNYPVQVMALWEEFRDAKTDAELYYTLIKISNLRHDRHLSVDTVEGGLVIEDTKLDQAPIQFRPDFGRSEPVFFVADYDTRIASKWNQPMPSVGDTLRAVNGITITSFVRQLEPYIRYSTERKLRWEIADSLAEKELDDIDAKLFRDDVTYTLMRSTGESYDLQLPYIEDEDITWAGTLEKKYTNFDPVLETKTYTLYVYQGDQKVILLDWVGFKDTLIADVDALVKFAEANNLLDHDIIFDGTTSRGGSRGAYALARLTDQSFKTTFGNLRISDIIPAFISDKEADFAKGDIDNFDGGVELINWLRTDVQQAYDQGLDYAPAAPFKLADLPKSSEGIMQPAPVHFRGRMACFFSPKGGSHLDQFAAMVADNDLCHLIGMSAGGYSNTWEWEEVLKWPDGTPIVEYMWNIGHTIRPNGKILESNPALPDELFPMTSDNFETYHDQMIDRAFKHFYGNPAPSLYQIWIDSVFGR
ncbi:MAG: hypothetical protein MI924_25090 [Chloroflexales bacterium]|nr:hypothetical protein [Chloroflexales bacterium]